MTAPPPTLLPELPVPRLVSVQHDDRADGYVDVALYFDNGYRVAFICDPSLFSDLAPSWGDDE